MRPRILLGWALGALLPTVVPAQETARTTQDPRLRAPRTTNDPYHPWAPPATREEWQLEADRLRDQVLVATGLLPRPAGGPIEERVHATFERDDYTVQNVSLVLAPGHAISGNLYLPKGFEGPRPAVLSPHGHWGGGRLYDAGEAEARKQIDMGAERFPDAARYPLQARCVLLARMGFVVFHYDMVGFGSSRGLPHGEGFQTVEDLLHGRSLLGLQTWHSIRALDWLTGRPEVDPRQIGVTGASGGGTQTFLLGAIDPRPDVAFPAVMVSTGMQGGCICENAPYLRVDANNVALAALFAPKPLAMTGADDWTREIETKGLPELQAIYGLLGHPERVAATAFPQFPHNYNAVSREVMARWFHRWFRLPDEVAPVERDFAPIPPADLDIPHPAGGGESREATRAYWESVLESSRIGPEPWTDQQADAVRRALAVLVGRMPEADQVRARRASKSEDGFALGWWVTRHGGERVHLRVAMPEGALQGTVLWVDGRGQRPLLADEEARRSMDRLLAQGLAVVVPELLGLGAMMPGKEGMTPQVPPGYAGFHFALNRPLISERARDLMAVLRVLPDVTGPGPVHLVATHGAGRLAVLAAAAAGRAFRSLPGVVHADLDGRGLGSVPSVEDPDFLPSALRYGGLGGLLQGAAPLEGNLFGVRDRAAQEMEDCRSGLAHQEQDLSADRVAAVVLGS